MHRIVNVDCSSEGGRVEYVEIGELTNRTCVGTLDVPAVQHYDVNTFVQFNGVLWHAVRGIDSDHSLSHWLVILE